MKVGGSQNGHISLKKLDWDLICFCIFDHFARRVPLAYFKGHNLLFVFARYLPLKYTVIEKYGTRVYTKFSPLGRVHVLRTMLRGMQRPGG